MSDNEQKPEPEKAPSQPSPPTVKADPAKTHMVFQWQHTRPLISCRVDPLSRFVVSGAQGNTLQRWNWETGKKTEFAGHDSWARAIEFSDDGQTLLTGGYDGRLIWWPAAAEKPEPIRKIDAHDGWVRAVRYSPDQQTIATCGNDNLIKLWSAADGQLVRTMTGHERHVYNVAFHPSGEHLVSFDLMGVIKQWEVATGKEVRQFDGKLLHKYDPTFHADIGGARSMAFSPDGKYFACGGQTEVTNAFAGQGQPMVLLFDWASEKPEPVQKFKLKAKFTAVAWGVEFHPDGFIVALFSGGSGGLLAFFRPDAPNEFFQLKLPTHCHGMDLAPDGLSLAVAHYDSKMRIYRMTEKEKKSA